MRDGKPRAEVLVGLEPQTLPSTASEFKLSVCGRCRDEVPDSKALLILLQPLLLSPVFHLDVKGYKVKLTRVLKSSLWWVKGWCFSVTLLPPFLNTPLQCKDCFFLRRKSCKASQTRTRSEDSLG